MTTEERRKIIDKGRRWFSAYLNKMAEDAMSDKSRQQIVRVACSMYRKKMKNDERFFNTVAEFCSEKRLLSEKNEFFRNIMYEFVRDGKLKAEYKKKYPDEFRHDFSE